MTGEVAAQGYVAGGLRWIGAASTCTAPPSWTAEPLLSSPGLPALLRTLCSYTWSPAVPGTLPSPTHIAKLASVSGALQLTEDVPVVFPMAPPTTAEAALFAGLRQALRAHVGDASMLPSMPATPAVRIVLIDTAPDAPHGLIRPGLSRHGDTLAHLIEDLVCLPCDSDGCNDDGRGTRRCAAEVTTELALPWISRGVPGSNGGYVGTLADLARAIDRAMTRWQNDLASGVSTPPQLLLNLSVGWEHTPGIADCSTTSPDLMAPPARAVLGILQVAASRGVLIVAAAGNDSGGPAPRTGLLCPGRYQAIARDADPSQSLLIAASGVDYADHPLETARPHGLTGIAALGLGGVAWDPADPVPPQLVGSSVSAAVVSAVSALVWAHQPSWTPSQVTRAVHDGGVEVGAADECPRSIGACRSHRVSTCGALQAAGATLACVRTAAEGSSWPALPAEVTALAAEPSNLTPSTGTVLQPLPLSSIARYAQASVQLQPSIFPMPISATCPTCRVISSSSAGPRYLVLPGLGQTLSSATLVVRLTSNELRGLALGAQQLSSATAYKFSVPASWSIQSAYLTGLDALQYSVTEQIFVEP